MSRQREKELLEKLGKNSHNDIVMAFAELFQLRLERYKDALVTQGCDIKRGMASELKDLLKQLEKAA